jgi:Dolichyl-phosphate-mannose-protein mannosyltransferase
VPLLATIREEAARPPLALLIAIAAMATLRGLVAAATNLSDDEAYYRLRALAPALSYFDHPPMVAWMIAAGRGLLGDNPLGIRAATVLTGLLGPLLLWRTTFMLFGASVAARAVWFALAMPLLTVGGIIITPDRPSVTGRVSRAASKPPTRSCQHRNHCQFARALISQSRMPAPTKRFVYLDSRPRPANRPMASHQFGLRET